MKLRMIVETVTDQIQAQAQSNSIKGQWPETKPFILKDNDY